MDKRNKDRKKKEEERRRSERFAWLGPLMERRKAEPEPLEKREQEDDPETVED